jgi:hypothetical protein
MKIKITYNGGFETYFSLMKLKDESGKQLNDYLHLFDINDYIIYKSGNRFKQTTLEELLEFRYSRYILFNKNYIDIEKNDLWIGWLYNVAVLGSTLAFWNTEFPNFNPYEKIKIIEWQTLKKAIN